MRSATVSLEGNVIGESGLRNDCISEVTRTFEIALPNEQEESVEITGIVTDYKEMSEKDGIETVSTSIQCTGPATFYTDGSIDLTGLVITGDVSGALDIEYTGTPYHYRYTAGSSDSTVTVTPTGSGVIRVDGTVVATGVASGSISIPETIIISVKETGKAPKVYVVDVVQ